MNSNYPPGVTYSMIPGNRPEDMAHEKEYEDAINKYTDEIMKHVDECEYLTREDLTDFMSDLSDSIIGALE